MLTASERARVEADNWAEIAGHWNQTEVPELWVDRPPTEKATVIFYDPAQDLAQRAREWGHQLEGNDLSSLALFAAGLARAEERGWEQGTQDIATQAYEARKFLMGDRVAFWAIPWLDSVSRGYPRYGARADLDRDLLLHLADEARIAPMLPGTEGIFMEGEDSYGPVDPGVHWPRWTDSLWSGAVVLETDRTTDRVVLYDQAAGRWADLGTQHSGSAQLWLDLSERASGTAARLGSKTREVKT
jgi:hypothetical protein